MHVGRGAGDFAQARRLEGAQAGCAAWHGAAPRVLAAQADVVEAVIGEAPAIVAKHAASLAREELEASQLRGAERSSIALDPVVETRRRRDKGAHIGGQGL